MDYDQLAKNGLVLFDRIRDVGEDTRSLRRDADRGILVKLRRGAYVTNATWQESGSRARHLLRARAVIAASTRPVALAGVSAAAVWAMPLNEPWPDEVTVLDQWRGGGRSEPGVRKTAAGFATATIQTVDGIPVTSLARTALDIARTHGFADVTGSLDWALWHRRSGHLDKVDLWEELDSMNLRSGLRHLRRCIEFSTHVSESYGESKTRAVIHLLDFEPPELQVGFHDREGYIYPDYFWRSTMIAGEFDGKAKYTRNEYTKGDAGEAAWKEKKREDRLRRMVSGVTRILMDDVEHPRRLERLLMGAGVPRGQR